MGYVVKITREPGKGAATKADAIADALLENGKIAEKILDAMRKKREAKRQRRKKSRLSGGGKKNARSGSLLRRGCSGDHRSQSSSKTAKNKQK